MKSYTEEELRHTLEKHQAWLDTGGSDGCRANLSSADLSFANLRSADLRFANLRFANLRFANLSFANLRSADLRSANLRSANLRSANLSSADLRSANLRFANLQNTGLLIIHIGKFTAYVDPTHMRTGCQYMTHKEWKAVEVDTLTAPLATHETIQEHWVYRPLLIEAMRRCRVLGWPEAPTPLKELKADG